jgi:hypothetical protein
MWILQDVLLFHVLLSVMHISDGFFFVMHQDWHMVIVSVCYFAACSALLEMCFLMSQNWAQTRHTTHICHHGMGGEI